MPTPTLYRPATSPTDYKLCHALLEATDGDAVTFGFPTILAVREHILTGFLGTQRQGNVVIAGPLALDPSLKQPIWTIMRLIEVYEVLLRALHVQSYAFGLDTTNPRWQRIVEKFGLTPHTATDTAHWYIRQVPA